MENLDNKFPIAYESDMEMIAAYVIIHIDHDYHENLMKKFLSEIEEINSRQFVVDTLLLVEKILKILMILIGIQNILLDMMKKLKIFMLIILMIS